MASDEMSINRIKPVPKIFGSTGDPKNLLCKYVHRYCFQERIHGYDFCIRHILEDKNAPFKQCTYVQQPHKKRCTNAAPKTDKSDRRETLCPFHVKQSLLKMKTPIVRKMAIKGPKALLRSLEHYCKNAHHTPGYSKKIDQAEKYEIAPCDIQCPTSLRPPGIDDTAEKDVSEKSSSHMDTFEDHRDWEVNSKDVLRHAGIFTGKEVIALAREKSMRLKSLYIDELKRTYYRLKELRREYLREAKIEKTRKHSGKLLSTSKSKMLRYLETYHSPFGVDKVMRQKSERKRMGIITHQPSCTFIQNGKKCAQTAIVSASYCLNHIMSDPKQCLFVPCSITSKKNCDRPVLLIGDNFSVCKLHLHATLFPESKEISRESKESKERQAVAAAETSTEQEHFQSMDDIASLGLEDITGDLFRLDQILSELMSSPEYAELGESTDTVMSEEQADLMQIQPITPNPPADILSDVRKSDVEEEM